MTPAEAAMPVKPRASSSQDKAAMDFRALPSNAIAAEKTISSSEVLPRPFTFPMSLVTPTRTPAMAPIPTMPLRIPSHDREDITCMESASKRMAAANATMEMAIFWMVFARSLSCLTPLRSPAIFLRMASMPMPAPPMMTRPPARPPSAEPRRSIGISDSVLSEMARMPTAAAIFRMALAWMLVCMALRVLVALSSTLTKLSPILVNRSNTSLILSKIPAPDSTSFLEAEKKPWISARITAKRES